MNEFSQLERAPARRRLLPVVVAGIVVAGLAGTLAWRESATHEHSSTSTSACADDLEGPSALVSFDPATGARRWSRAIGEVSGAAQLHGIIAAMGFDGRAVGVDPGTGDVRWCRDLGARPPGTASLRSPGFVAGNDVVVTLTSSGEVSALDPLTGTTVWKEPLAGFEGVSMLVGGPVIYAIGIPVIGPVPAGAAPAATQPPAVVAAFDATTGAVLHDPPPPPTAPSSAAGELVSATTYSADRQDITVGVRDPATQIARWSTVVPGTRATLTGEIVFVLDQTGGTGDASGFYSSPPQVDSGITAYAASTGERLWRVAVPGTPQETFDAGAQVVVASGSRVFAIDTSAGAIAWSADHGSPGVTDRYSEIGTYRWFGGDASTGSVIGLIVAEEPYED